MPRVLDARGSAARAAALSDARASRRWRSPNGPRSSAEAADAIAARGQLVVHARRDRRRRARRGRRGAGRRRAGRRQPRRTPPPSRAESPARRARAPSVPAATGVAAIALGSAPPSAGGWRTSSAAAARTCRRAAGSRRGPRVLAGGEPVPAFGDVAPALARAALSSWDGRLYRALALGTMSASPDSASGAAALPVIVGIAGGERQAASSSPGWRAPGSSPPAARTRRPRLRGARSAASRHWVEGFFVAWTPPVTRPTSGRCWSPAPAPR